MPEHSKHDWVVARPLLLFSTVAEQRGVDSQGILTSCGFTQDDLDDPDNHLGLQPVLDAYERIARELGDDAVVFDIFDHPPVGYGSVIDYVFLCAASLEEGLRNWERFYLIRSDCVEICFERTPEEASLELRVPEHFGPNAQFTYGFIALIASRLAEIIGVDPPSIRIEVGCKKPDSGSDFLTKYANKISFEHQTNRIVIPERYLNIVPKTTDPSLFSIVETTALDSLESISTNISLTSQTAAKISQGLRAGHCSIDYVSQSLGVSNRSLQRNLAGEGTSFRSILERVRCSMAQRYLVDTKRPVSEIAFLLGFSEVSAFSRAVKNWFGLPPRALRERQGRPDKGKGD